MSTEAHQVLVYTTALDDIQHEVESLVLERLITIVQGDLIYARIVKLRNQCHNAFRTGAYPAIEDKKTG